MIFAYAGIDPKGRTCGGQVECEPDQMPEFVRDLYEKGYRMLAVRRGGQGVAYIGRGEVGSIWWSESGDGA